MSRRCRNALALGLLLAMPALGFAAAEPNTQVPVGSPYYAATTVPDRIVASPSVPILSVIRSVVGIGRCSLGRCRRCPRSETRRS